MKLMAMKENEVHLGMEIIDAAKAHLKEQGIDQWQTGYPDFDCLKSDSINNKGFFIVDNEDVLGYLCIDFEGEPAYDNLNGSWNSDESYVVVHRMAFNDKARGRKLSDIVFGLVEEMSRERGVNYFRVDTDADNKKMQHILSKNGFSYCGTIWFDNSEKIAFDKKF